MICQTLSIRPIQIYLLLSSLALRTLRVEFGAICRVSASGNNVIFGTNDAILLVEDGLWFFVEFSDDLAEFSFNVSRTACIISLGVEGALEGLSFSFFLLRLDLTLALVCANDLSSPVESSLQTDVTRLTSARARTRISS